VGINVGGVGGSEDTTGCELDGGPDIDGGPLVPAEALNVVERSPICAEGGPVGNFPFFFFASKAPVVFGARGLEVALRAK